MQQTNGSRKLLIVSNESVTRDSLQFLLAKHGYTVITTNSGNGALKILSEQNIPVVITNQKMPEMKGAELLLQIKNNYPNIIRMLISDYDDVAEVAEAINNGAVYKFLTKPCQEQSLITHVNSAFELHDKISAQRQSSHVFNHAIEAIAITDENGIVQSVNDAYKKVINDQSPVGSELRIIKDQKFPSLKDLFSTVKQKKSWHGEMWIENLKGTNFLSYMTVYPILSAQNNISGFTFTFLSLSDKSHYDPLTGLIKRNYFHEKLKHIIKEKNKSEAKLGLITLDIEHYKSINDVFGFRVGDALLIAITERLQKFINKECLIARFANSDLAIINPTLTDNNSIKMFSQSLFKIFNAPFVVEENELHVSPNIGISIYPDDSEDATELINCANTAVSQAKKQRLNQVQYYDQTIRAKIAGRLEMKKDLHKAIENNEFELYFQPKMSLKTNQINSAEGLIRWNHPKHGLIKPDTFIPLCEELGLISEIGKVVLTQGVKSLQHWDNDDNANFSLSLNLSTKDFLEPNFISVVEKSLEKSAIKPERIELEITESLLFEDIKRSEKLLHRLNEFGIKLALDDFGTGYSSLSYLSHLPFDTIKIDKLFTQNMLINSKACTIMFAILDLCKRLSLDTVVEGVETSEQVNLLRAQNCDFIQGHWVSEALPFTELYQLIKDK